MGSSKINLHGDQITTHVLDSAEAVDKHIADLRRYLECNAKVIGLDIKTKLKPNGGSHIIKQHILVLCVFRRCLIIHLDYITKAGIAPQSLHTFLNDPKICFVGATTLPDMKNWVQNFSNLEVGVKVGDLAAIVLRKPALTELSLGDLAKEFVVAYQGETAEIVVNENNRTVLTEEQIRSALNDAYAYYQIGYKLLTSL
ncbi:hypothetical protein BVRB_4g080320 [Beta vulgaris subsp. vulgaris]|nr:hypothetical protein BVRB_4g080320 [Beta vulgaris subsp. vulgaris]